MDAHTDTPLDQLEAQIVRLGEDLAQRAARWLALVAEFDRRGGARRWGFRGTAEWLAWRCGIGPRTAREHVRVARALDERPTAAAAFASGELSYSKIRAVTRAPADREEELTAVAADATASELERLVRGLRQSPSADVDVANAVHARRYVSWSWDPDGALDVRGRLPAEDGAALIEAIDTAAERLHEAALVPRGARRADGLAELAHSGCPRTQVVLHVDSAALACTADDPAERAGETCALTDGPALPSETARRLSCDADLTTVPAEDGAATLAYGRTRRTIPPPLRTRLQRDDPRCRFPGCERRHGLHGHHMVHWIHGGTTDEQNIVLLCRYHHRLVHEEGFTVARRRDGTLQFDRPDGVPVPARPPTGRHGDMEAAA